MINITLYRGYLTPHQDQLVNIAKLALWVFDNQETVKGHFDMSTYIRNPEDFEAPVRAPATPLFPGEISCGTCACFVGWAPTAGIGLTTGPMDWDEYIREFFTSGSSYLSTSLFAAAWTSSSLLAVWRAQEILKGGYVGFNGSHFTSKAASKTWKSYLAILERTNPPVGGWEVSVDVAARVRSSEVELVDALFLPEIDRDFLSNIAAGKFTINTTCTNLVCTNAQ